MEFRNFLKRLASASERKILGFTAVRKDVSLRKSLLTTSMLKKIMRYRSQSPESSDEPWAYPSQCESAFEFDDDPVEEPSVETEWRWFDNALAQTADETVSHDTLSLLSHTPIENDDNALIDLMLTCEGTLSAQTVVGESNEDDEDEDESQEEIPFVQISGSEDDDTSASLSSPTPIPSAIVASQPLPDNVSFDAVLVPAHVHTTHSAESILYQAQATHDAAHVPADGPNTPTAAFIQIHTPSNDDAALVPTSLPNDISLRPISIRVPNSPTKIHSIQQPISIVASHAPPQGRIIEDAGNTQAPTLAQESKNTQQRVPSANRNTRKRVHSDVEDDDNDIEYQPKRCHSTGQSVPPISDHSKKRSWEEMEEPKDRPAKRQCVHSFRVEEDTQAACEAARAQQKTNDSPANTPSDEEDAPQDSLADQPSPTDTDSDVSYHHLSPAGPAPTSPSPSSSPLLLSA